MEGGRYRPLSDHEVERIHPTSLDLLQRIGIAEPSAAWRDRVLPAGGRLNE